VAFFLLLAAFSSVPAFGNFAGDAGRAKSQ
jgi:hypothetical protein